MRHAVRVNGSSAGLRRSRPLSAMRDIGPELISGAADNDPTNMGTAAVVGAQTGYRLCWVTLAVAPLLAVVLNIAAQVASAARSDLQSLVLARYGRGVAAFLMVSVVIVNLVTIAADLKAGAAGIGLLTGVNARWLILPLAAALTTLLLAGKYGQVVQVLRFLLPGFLAFTAAAVLARPDWPQLLAGSLVPRLSLRPGEISGALALLGTTLTSYVYVWETIQRGLEEAPQQGPDSQRRARATTGAGVGAVFTSLVLWSMVATSAATLGRTHVAISSAQDAAPVLRPLAGGFATTLFAAGLIVSAVVALPVLVATTAYVVGAQYGWRRGLSRPIDQARRFYVTVTGSVALAAGLALANVSVLGLLVAASVLGGIGTPVGLALLVRLARDAGAMGGQPISRALAAAGWAVTALLAAAALLYIATGIPW